MRAEQAVNEHPPQVYWGAPRNLGLGLVRATEAAALAAGRWMGLGQREKDNEDADAASAMGGGMPGRLYPQSAGEEEAVPAVGLDTRQILACGELISCNEIIFSATGITDGALLSGVHYLGDEAKTESLVLRGETGTRRFIRTEHRLNPTSGAPDRAWSVNVDKASAGQALLWPRPR